MGVQSGLCDVGHFWAVAAATVVKHLLDDQPEEKGDMLGMFSRAASQLPLCLQSVRCTSLRISLGSLEMLVVTPKAWEKEAFSGPRPVLWAGTVTSLGSVGHGWQPA